MRWRNAWVWLGLALITLAVYSPVLRNDFINLDDQGYVTENPHVTNGLSWEGIKWSFTSAGYASNWHPLTWISHMMDCQFFGLNAHLDLADLLADIGKFSEAATEAGKARDAATVAKRTDLISVAQKRLELFHAGKAYHEAQ